MHHNHQTHSYNAKKSVPLAVLKEMTPVGKRIIKKQHTKRSRRFLKKEANESDC